MSLYNKVLNLSKGQITNASRPNTITQPNEDAVDRSTKQYDAAIKEFRYTVERVNSKFSNLSYNNISAICEVNEDMSVNSLFWNMCTYFAGNREIFSSFGINFEDINDNFKLSLLKIEFISNLSKIPIIIGFFNEHHHFIGSVLLNDFITKEPHETLELFQVEIEIIF